MSKFLSERYNYKTEDMVILMDDPSFNWRQQPTRQNILEAMKWLVGGAQPNDSLFFHYSGHGGQAKDVSGDEVRDFELPYLRFLVPYEASDILEKADS